MKVALRILAVLVLLLLMAVGGAYIWRMPLVAWLAVGQLEKLGLTDPDVTITELTTTNVALSLSSAEISGNGQVTYDLGALLRERRVEDINLASIESVIRLRPEGKVEIEGIDLPKSDGAGGEIVLPFQTINIGAADLNLLTPQGDGHLTGAVAFDKDTGGEITFRLTGARLGLEAMRAEELSAEAVINLSTDGKGTFEGYLKGDFLTDETMIRNADLNLDGRVIDWRPLIAGKIPEEGRLSVEIGSASIGTETTILQTISEGAAPLEAELELVTLTGSLEAIIEAGVVTVRIPGTPIEATGTTGSYIRILPEADEPLLVWSDASATAAAGLEVNVPQMAGMLTLSADQSRQSPWQVEVSGAITRGVFGAMTMTAHRLSANGTYKDGVLRLDSDLAGRLGNLQVGALTVKEAMLRAKLPLLLDMPAQVFSIPATDNTSIVIGGARLRSANGSVTANLGPTEVLPKGGPLLNVEYGEGGSISGGAGVRLSRLSARAGETSLTASQLRGEASLDFDNAEQSTTLVVSLTDGTALVNETLAFSKVAVDGQISVLMGEAQGRAQVQRVMVTEARDAPRVAPMLVSGPAELSDGTISFDMKVATENGARLGRVSGRHVFETGDGVANFDSGDLIFTPNGLQPSGLIPPLKGIVGTTTGSLTGRAQAEWGSGPLRTSATISPQRLSFTGPGVAVERTENVSGTLSFSSLIPVTTAGLQEISVGQIDFGSIALPDGKVEFAFPGDDTLVVEQAVFPLFDGRLIADDTVIGFDGGSIATLRVENIDLASVLAFIDVEGLNGAGKIEGALPIIFEDFAIRIENGELRATSPGSIQFAGDVASAAAQSNPGARLAFDALENLRFTVFSATVNGRLDGELDFTFDIIGESEVDLDGDGAAQDVTAPIILRTNIQMPLISLINQARMSFDARLQLEALQDASGASQE